MARLFVIRGRRRAATSSTKARSRLLSEVEASLQNQFRFARRAKVPRPARASVPGRNNRHTHGAARKGRRRHGRPTYQTIPGRPLSLRLSWSPVRARPGSGARHLAAVDKAASQCQRRDYRALVLLAPCLRATHRQALNPTSSCSKASTQHLEQWQQETATAIAKREADGGPRRVLSSGR